VNTLVTNLNNLSDISFKPQNHTNIRRALYKSL